MIELLYGIIRLTFEKGLIRINDQVLNRNNNLIRELAFIHPYNNAVRQFLIIVAVSKYFRNVFS